MPRFFDQITGDLYNVGPNAGGAGAPGQLSSNPLTLLPNPNRNGQLPILRLRRQNQGNQGTYVSLQSGETLQGNFDLNHPSNNDLRQVINIHNR